MQWIIDHFLHLDKYLGEIIENYGLWTYLLLFTVIFCETGLVVTPFLPGDSLIFAAGYFAAIGSLNIYVLLAVLISAAILGDSVNYWIGHFLGEKIFHKEDARILKRKYLDETHEFYERHGGATIILARFVPIVRTFSPFVAGVGRMTYMKFLSFDILGGVIWVSLFSLLGYFFGTIPFFKNNFSMVVIAIICISLVPFLIGYIRSRKKEMKEGSGEAEAEEAETTEVTPPN
jgi:membrane-associated protein